MRIDALPKPTACLLALVTLGVTGLLPGTAHSVPVVFTAGGSLGAVGGGGDPIHLAFATVRITLFADTSDAPTSTQSAADSLDAHYRPSSGLLEITNRPAGAPDLSLPYTPDLITTNVFQPSASPDTVSIDDGTTAGVPGTSTLFVGGVRLSFIDASFFPGTGPGPLPNFDVTGGAVVFGAFYDLDHSGLYGLTDPFLTVDVVPVPEPGTALLLASGLAALGVARLRTGRTS